MARTKNTCRQPTSTQPAMAPATRTSPAKAAAAAPPAGRGGGGRGRGTTPVGAARLPRPIGANAAAQGAAGPSHPALEDVVMGGAAAMGGGPETATTMALGAPGPDFDSDHERDLPPGGDEDNFAARETVRFLSYIDRHCDALPPPRRLVRFLMCDEQKKKIARARVYSSRYVMTAHSDCGCSRVSVLFFCPENDWMPRSRAKKKCVLRHLRRALDCARYV